MISVLAPLMGMAIPMIVVPAALLFKRFKLNRELEHRERMEAIRRGAPAPASSSLPGAGSVVVIGAGVPAAAVFCAWMATASIPHVYGDRTVVLISVIWGCALLVSVAALATSLVLGVLQHRAGERAAMRGSHSSTKPAHDLDAFDLTGRHAY